MTIIGNAFRHMDYLRNNRLGPYADLPDDHPALYGAGQTQGTPTSGPGSFNQYVSDTVANPGGAVISPVTGQPVQAGKGVMHGGPGPDRPYVEEVNPEQERMQRQAQLRALAEQARGSGLSATQNYFQQRGADPNKYNDAIMAEIDSIFSGIGPDESNPGQYFQTAPSSIYGRLETGRRSKAHEDLDSRFKSGFETQRIPFTFDDPYLESIENEQYGDIDSVIQNMLDRGVYTSRTAEEERRRLESQRPAARSRLNEVGTTALTQGQNKLRGVATGARQAADKLSLANDWNPDQYGTEADNLFNEFVSTLDGDIRGRLTDPLFKNPRSPTGGLFSGTQNLQGTPRPDEPDDEFDVENSGPNSVF